MALGTDLQEKPDQKYDFTGVDDTHIQHGQNS